MAKLKYNKVPDEYRPAKKYKAEKLKTMRAGAQEMYDKYTKNPRIGTKTLLPLIQRRIKEIDTQLKAGKKIKKDVEEIKDEARPMKPKTKLQRRIVGDVEYHEIEKSDDPNSEWWHGSPSGDLTAAKSGIHIGSRKAAEQALHSRIGIPSQGTWDGTREYGKTQLKGRKNLLDHERTGYNADSPDEDHLPTGKARYGDGTPVKMTDKPNIFPVKIKGNMKNSPKNPASDDYANSRIKRQTKMGNAKHGYYYRNIAEDEGSVSAVVPHHSHLERKSGDVIELMYQTDNLKDQILKQVKNYLAPGQQAPEDAEVFSGARGGKYYMQHGSAGPKFDDANAQSAMSNPNIQTGMGQQPMMPQKPEEPPIEIVEPKLSEDDKLQRNGYVPISGKIPTNISYDNDDPTKLKEREVDNQKREQQEAKDSELQNDEDLDAKPSPGDKVKKMFSTTIGVIEQDYNRYILKNSTTSDLNSSEGSNNIDSKHGMIKTNIRKSIDQLTNLYNITVNRETEHIILDNTATNSSNNTDTSKTVNNISKSIDNSTTTSNLNTDLYNFLVGYKAMSMLGPDYNDEKLAGLYKIGDRINKSKQYSLKMDDSSRIEVICSIDAVAHSMHQESHEFKKSNGVALYPLLDQLADISKDIGESNRDDRLILLSKGNTTELDRLNSGIKVFTKSLDFDNGRSYWKLMEAAIKGGVKSLSDDDLILLREWMYSRV